MTGPGRLADPAKVLANDDSLAKLDGLRALSLAASNVRPAFETSLRFGVGAGELRALGLDADSLGDAEAPVTALATYRHLELMAGRGDFAAFMIQAAQAHGAGSLGVLGLAIKSTATVGEALGCHHRFQSLTNRSAAYVSAQTPAGFELQEERFGAPIFGSLLMSDYTMLVAVHLLRQLVRGPLPLRAVHSRRREMPGEQRQALEDFLGAPMRLAGPELGVGAGQARLCLDPSFPQSPVASGDAEIAAYFRSLLEQALPQDADEAPLLRQLRAQLQDLLVRGRPGIKDLAALAGMGQRTLQRRLSEQGTSFAELLESTRRRLAQGYLRDESLSLTEIAYLLGYSDPPSFHRSFRRWFDETPAQHRERLRTRRLPGPGEG